MGKYIVSTGQNLYDVSLHIYGSIEGIVDLMMNNPELSLAYTLQSGDELLYTDDYIIDADIVVYNRMNNIIPANGERHVYFKSSALPLVAEIYLKNSETNAGFSISGKGLLDVDWGDNTPIQQISLMGSNQSINHSFDNLIAGQRKIRLYGSISIKELSLSELNPEAIYLLKPLDIESFILENANLAIDYISLFNDIYKLNLTGLRTNDLSPLLTCKNLITLDLSEARISRAVLDDYLISLVKKYYGRRNCTITTTVTPSGIYQEPKRDSNNNFILTTGMEAIWLLVNEPAWNEAGKWKFVIKDKIYCI